MPFRRTSIDSNQRTGFYSPKRSRVVGSRVVGYDPDAFAYFTAVEAADGQALEGSVKDAYNAFVVGCKTDGIWTAIKASCILAGARTLTGALVPLVGTAPTNNNFVSGDYNRETGLVGDGSTKYLNSNRNNNADPQNSKHLSTYLSNPLNGAIIGAFPAAVFTGLTWIARDATTTFIRVNAGSSNSVVETAPTAFIGASRSSATVTVRRVSSLTSSSFGIVSESPANDSISLFRQGSSGANYSSSRLAFYSIGESLDLALLDTRVTALINAIAAAIP